MKIVTGSLVLLSVLLFTITGCTTAEIGLGTIDVVATSTLVDQGENASETEIEISTISANISEIKVYSAGVILGEDNEQGEWINLYLTSKPLNLLQNSKQEQFLAFADVPATSYDEIVIVIDRLDVTLSNDAKVTITPNEPFVFDASIVVYNGKTTTIVFKFNIDKSVTYTDENKTIIKPLTSITLNVRYEEIDS
jgi:hypothetical protein